MKTAATFKQADLERAVRAARACDLPIHRTEIDRDGRIILVHSPDGGKVEAGSETDFDAWRAKRDARPA